MKKLFLVVVFFIALLSVAASSSKGADGSGGCPIWDCNFSDIQVCGDSRHPACFYPASCTSGLFMKTDSCNNAVDTCVYGSGCVPEPIITSTVPLRNFPHIPTKVLRQITNIDPLLAIGASKWNEIDPNSRDVSTTMMFPAITVTQSDADFLVQPNDDRDESRWLTPIRHEIHRRAIAPMTFKNGRRQPVAAVVTFRFNGDTLTINREGYIAVIEFKWRSSGIWKVKLQ